MHKLKRQISFVWMWTICLLLSKKLWKRIVGGMPLNKKFMPLKKKKKRNTHTCTHTHTHTWELSTLPLGQRTIGVKWVYKIKHTVDGRIKCYNARLVVKGYKKKYGIKYEEVFTSVVRLDMVRMLISFVAQWHTGIMAYLKKRCM